MLSPVKDKIAQKLEAAGYWRRASTRWLFLMNSREISDSQREWIKQRRRYCILRLSSKVTKNY
ncbi:TPA: PerC family transcriptional regulator [Klebsiella pneumoniae]|nr:PerC family transcriptional regulator [Klebsiella pneumoniae subsp. pneumoniae]HDH0888866.1 PerC family transcriptional regulator [Klebsiella pneumoniae]